MNISITNFYNVRFLNPWQLPVSTAMWDPKWFHDNQDPTHVFIDRNGVINGMRCDWFVPGQRCGNLCQGFENCKMKSPANCAFLEQYRRQLDDIVTMTLMERFREWLRAISIKSGKSMDECEIVLLVYEKIDNPCSERWAIIDWFEAQGIEIRSY